MIRYYLELRYFAFVGLYDMTGNGKQNITVINMHLNEFEPLTKIEIEQENYEGKPMWKIKIDDGVEGVIIKDSSGVWMQRSKDNLCPVIIQKVGEAIEECFLYNNI